MVDRLELLLPILEPGVRVRSATPIYTRMVQHCCRQHCLLSWVGSVYVKWWMWLHQLSWHLHWLLQILSRQFFLFHSSLYLSPLCTRLSHSGHRVKAIPHLKVLELILNNVGTTKGCMQQLICFLPMLQMIWPVHVCWLLQRRSQEHGYMVYLSLHLGWQLIWMTPSSRLLLVWDWALPLCAPHACHKVNYLGKHSLSCTFSGGRHHRHSAINLASSTGPWYAWAFSSLVSYLSLLPRSLRKSCDFGPITPAVSMATGVKGWV